MASTQNNADALDDLEFNLDGYRSKLDETGLQVASNQSASLEHKRALAEKTKEFKRTVSPDVFKAVSSLIRAYQEEIDSLSTRAKFGEAAFLDVYQRLYEAPDPAPALTSALDMAAQASDVEAQLLRVTAELAEYKAESASLQNQTHTIRALQEKVKSLESSLQEQDRALQQAAESTAAAEAARELEEAAEREARLGQRLEEAVNSLAAVKELHEASQNQLFSMQAAAEAQQAALQHELDLATQEAEAAQERVRAMQQELASHRSNGEAQPSRAELLAHDASLLQQLASSRDDAARLQAQVDALTAQLQATEEQAQARCAELQAALDAERGDPAAQQPQQAQQEEDPMSGRVAELQAQVQMLRAVAGYAVGEGGKEAEGGTTLEAMLLEKNRHLEHELTMARVAATDATTALEALRARMTDMETSLEHHKRLVARLEEDLLVAGGAEASAPEASEGNGQAAMVKVLSSQRDRLRTRCQQLEEEASAVGSALAKAKKDLEATKADNVALVERLRYVQGYSQEARSRPDVEVGEVEGRYNGLYESKVDPFTKFRDREREQRRRHMGMADRAMFLFGQLINSSKLARTLVFVYTLVLHALVFFMMMHAAHKTPSQSLALCGDFCARLQQQQAQVASSANATARGL